MTEEVSPRTQPILTPAEHMLNLCTIVSGMMANGFYAESTDADAMTVYHRRLQQPGFPHSGITPDNQRGASAMPTIASECYSSREPLETRDKNTYSSREAPELNPGPDVPQLEAPTVTAIEPNTLLVPGPDTEVVLTGTGFNEGSQIIWNGSAEPTTYYDSEHLSTIVRPSTVEAELPITLPVAVLNGTNLSDPVEFTLVASEA